MSYGWLRNNPHEWCGDSSAGASGYEYGWPSGGTLESDVVAQWLFDEAAGNIVDEVVPTTLTAAGGAATYSQTLSGLYAGISPGIDFNNVAYFEKAGADANHDIGTNDFTFEAWFRRDDAARYAVMDTLGGGNGWDVEFLNSNSGEDVFLFLDPATQQSITIRMTSAFNDGDPHKARWVGDRSGNAELFIDGVSQGTGDISGSDGEAITCGNLTVGARVGGLRPFNGVLYELRHSNNATNNSGGPNGG